MKILFALSALLALDRAAPARLAASLPGEELRTRAARELEGRAQQAR